MKLTRYLILIPICSLLFGCGGSGSATAIEGLYVQADKPDVTLSIKNGRYQRGTSSLGFSEGTFTARKIDDATFELDVAYSGQSAGLKDSTLVIRKQGDSIFLKNRADGVELEYKRK
jgi:hypothetical protein